MNKVTTSLISQLGRQRLVAAALAFVEGTTLAPTVDERVLLHLFVQGDITIDQVLDRLELIANDYQAPAYSPRCCR